MTKFKKTSLTVLSVTMAAAIAAGQIAAFSNGSDSTLSNETVRDVSARNLTDSLDLSDISRSQLADNVFDTGEDMTKNLNEASNRVATVLVSFETPSLVEAMVQANGDAADVAEFINSSDGGRALKDIEKAQNDFFANLSSAGISYKVVDKYTTVMSGVAIEVNTSQFSKLKKFANVSMAGVSKTYQALSTVDAQVNYSNVYSTGIYDSSKITEKYHVDGSGMAVAVLDTGLDYTHPAFSHDPTEVSIDRDKVIGVLGDLKATKRDSSATIADLYISKKVPFVFDYADNDPDVYPSYSQHGVHVSGIIAGKDEYYVNKDGEEIGKGDGKWDFLGAAPEAQIVVCKVFTDDLNSSDLGGATSEDIVAALDDCVTLGVDIINMSLGTASGFSNLDIDGDEEGAELKRVYESVKDAGISLITAAGNEYSSGSGSEFGTNLASNPDSGTVGSPSTFTGALSVASVNGLPSPYLVANENEEGAYGSVPIYYNDSNNANAVPYDFADEMLDGDPAKTEAEFTYLVIPGIGSAGDYSRTVQNRLRPVSEGGLKQSGEKIIVVVRRGTSDFKTKVEIAHTMNADGIIVYNNVPGTIRMSLNDIEEENRIPAISINMDAGEKLTTDPKNPNRLRSEGKLKVDRNALAGPFMNDYSSWGATPTLELKPEITSHGGEITSTVSGGYAEMSGTSMATPNLAGLMALVRSYVKKNEITLFGQELSNVELTRLINQIVMSSATLLYDEEKLPYSPRKQGAGLATLDNIFTTKAYLYTDGEFHGEDNRPKIELKEDEEKKGEYTFTFKVKNFDKTTPLTFTLVPRFMTESISSDGLAVAEAAHMFDENDAKFQVSGTTLAEGNKITVAANSEASITVTLTLSSSERDYLNKNFVNGMYVEGFISLVSDTNNVEDGQCDLNLPFMGFYGDWEAAPMLDYNAYEIAAIEQDTSINDNEKPHESIFATQLYSTYYNGKYAVPMGGFAYVQDEFAEQIYVSEEHCAVSRFNVFTSATDTSNYLTSTGVRALYAGLLRNAELVTYDLYNVNTGELVYQGRKYRVGKAYAGGGSARPALVDLRDDYIDSEHLPLINNGKYEMDFKFYMKADDENTEVKYANTFNSTFYVDFDAPLLEGSRIRYYDYQENNKDKQLVYLDLDIYDNHYPQSVLLCYSDEAHADDDTPSTEPAEINLATEYVTPIYNPGRNTTTTVSIDITDIYEKYKDHFYVQIDDYALNHSVYEINFSSANLNSSNSEFGFVLNDRVTSKSGNSNTACRLTLEKNEVYKVQLASNGANASNYTWATTRTDIIKVKNGEIFGVKPGEATLSVKGGAGTSGSRTISLDIEVVDSNRTLSSPNLTFGVIKGTNSNLEVAQGTVNVNAGQTFQMDIIPDPWYYPIENLQFQWTSSNEKYVTIENIEGEIFVKTKNEHGSSVIRAAVIQNGVPTNTAATVTLRVAEPFNISNMTLTDYYGDEETVRIPDDENVMYIDEEAFKDNDTMKYLYIPRTVTQISERAFLNCTKLEEVYFIDKTEEPVKDLAAISLILADAFSGCTNLRKIDLTNVKVVTIGDHAFDGCGNLSEIVHMEKIGIAGVEAFANCTALQDIDITGLHTAGIGVFFKCTGLKTVKTDKYTNISAYMFRGCSNLGTTGAVEINTARVSENAFRECTGLTSVKFGGENTKEGTTFRIDSYAFAGCTHLSTVEFNDYPVSYIGDYAFASTAIEEFTMPNGNPVLGETIFDGVDVTITWGNGYENYNTTGAIYSGTKLVKAPATIDSSFAIKPGTTEIGPFAFTDSRFNEDVATVEIPESVTVLGEGAFAGAGIKTITIPQNITSLPVSAFRQSSLTTIQIPATVTSIGDRAFEGCENLETITFAQESTLESIGNRAFVGCAISQIELPDGAATMGVSVFTGCSNLETVKLPSVTSMGGYTFESCPALTTVTFGENATDTGVYTFFPGTPDGGYTYYESALQSVTLSDKITEIKEGVFYACSQLENIDIKNVTKLGNYAFAECDGLSQVTGLENVTDIGSYAFASMGVTNLTELNLESAKNIGFMAFVNSAATSLSIPVAENIGAQAFGGINITSLELPATLKTFGDGAFMTATELATVTMDENENFFVENSVLYRYVRDAKTGEVSYELCMYPAGKPGSSYTVKDGTSVIQARAFYGSYSEDLATAYPKLRTVDLPYSLKAIGAYAFANCTISTYNFRSINAPALLSEHYENRLEANALRSLYYVNFNTEVLYYFMGVDEDDQPITNNVTIGYPSNGIGYDNYIYRLYFGIRSSLGELMDDNTRALIALVDSFRSVSEISEWLTAEINDDNRAEIQAFADSVAEAHRMYLNIPTDRQRQFLNEGVDRAQKIFDIEQALRPVKVRFSIPFSIQSISINQNSAHKSTYVEGEQFDMTGLVLDILYDDYVTEQLTDLSEVSINPMYAGALHTYDSQVELNYRGMPIVVPVTVTSQAAEEPSEQPAEPGEPAAPEVPADGEGGGCAGCGTMNIGTTIGGTGLMLLTLAGALLIIQKTRRKANKN